MQCSNPAVSVLVYRLRGTDSTARFIPTTKEINAMGQRSDIRIVVVCWFNPAAKEEAGAQLRYFMMIYSCDYYLYEIGSHLISLTVY